MCATEGKRRVELDTAVRMCSSSCLTRLRLHTLTGMHIYFCIFHDKHTT